jgi:hypothetical protein
LLSLLVEQINIGIEILIPNKGEGKMRGINLIIAILMTIGIFIDYSHAIEEKRVKIFEMAESGQTFVFQMSPEEIASEDAENDRIAVMRKERLNKPKRRKKVIEMGESGQNVEFSMSPVEITTEDVDNARLIALRKSRLNKPKTPVASFEMAESGMVIEFPVDPPEIYAENRQR